MSKSKELLIVDDQPGIRLLLTDVLTSEGYSVTTANTGKEAVELLMEKEFSLVILDYKIPIIDGLGVLKRIEEAGIQTSAIIMSGLVEKIENELEAFPQVKKLLAKPFNIHEIPVIVQQAIDAT